VPEFFQEQVRGRTLGEALLREMTDTAHVRALQSEFRRIHEVLRCGGAARAASVILELVNASRTQPSGVP
jgi:lipid A disaccharide synthetase